jgi:hypothetical protein
MERANVGLPPWTMLTFEFWLRELAEWKPSIAITTRRRRAEVAVDFFQAGIGNVV